MIVSGLLGVFIGFVSAVPIAGPVSAIVFSHGMKNRYAQARWFVIGAAVIESAYAFLAFWGVNRFLSKFDALFFISNILAAAILASLGFYFYRSKKMRATASIVQEESPRAPKALLMGAGVTIVNPSLIATWGTSIATLYSMKFFDFTMENAASFCIGIGVGIVLWFNLLLKIIEKYREHFKDTILDRILKVIGVALIGLSLSIVLRIILSGAFLKLF